MKKKNLISRLRNAAEYVTIDSGDTMAMERIDKILSSQNIASRSGIKAMIKAGKILADGKIVKRPEEKFDPDHTVFTVNGETVAISKYIYIMMNKPKGVLSASKDGHATTVIDLLPEEYKRRDLFPAGRLDKDTEGFLLITNDGELAHKMLAPKSHVYKLYEAECDTTLTEDTVKAFAEGICEGETRFLPAELKLTGEKTALVEICEGKFHQIKRMFHAVGAEVVRLKRLKIGGVWLDESLSAGSTRLLTKSEVFLLLSRNHGIISQNPYTNCTI